MADDETPTDPRASQPDREPAPDHLPESSTSDVGEPSTDNPPGPGPGDAADPAPTPDPASDSGSTTEPESDHGIGRREFLNTTWKVLGAALVVEAVWTSYDILKPQKSAATGGILNAGKASDYPEGTVKYFLDGRCYVTSSGGNLVALFQKCPHLGCKVPFCDSSGQFECPCHGSRYNIRGEYIAGPAPHGMDRFPLKIDGGEVFVDATTPVTGPPRGIETVSNTPKGPSCAGSAGGGTGSSGGASPSAEATS